MTTIKKQSHLYFPQACCQQVTKYIAACRYVPQGMVWVIFKAQYTTPRSPLLYACNGPLPLDPLTAN